MKQPATRIARHAIESWLKSGRQAELHASIASYAEKHAGSDADIDGAMEEIAVEHLINFSLRKRKYRSMQFSYYMLYLQTCREVF